MIYYSLKVTLRMVIHAQINTTEGYVLNLHTPVSTIEDKLNRHSLFTFLGIISQYLKTITMFLKIMTFNHHYILDIQKLYSCVLLVLLFWESLSSKLVKAIEIT